jgi:hypothetical protein
MEKHPASKGTREENRKDLSPNERPHLKAQWGTQRGEITIRRT